MRPADPSAYCSVFIAVVTNRSVFLGIELTCETQVSSW